jgi:hypothetical protein
MAARQRSSPFVRADDQIFLSEPNFPDQVAAIMNRLLQQNNTQGFTSYRIYCRLSERTNALNQADVVLDQFMLERNPVEWFNVQRNLLPATPQQIMDDDNFKSLIEDSLEYIRENRQLELEEMEIFHREDGDVKGAPIISRKRRCIKENCRQRGWHLRNFFHVPDCGVQFEDGQRCEFYVNPDLLVPTSIDGFVFYLRSAAVPEILMVPDHELATNVHENRQLCLDPRLWNGIKSFINSHQPGNGEHTKPFIFSVNFGEWETAVSSNHLQARRHCHGHIHLVYPKLASLHIPRLKGRIRTPEFYRVCNIQAMNNTLARYNNERIHQMSITLQNMNEKIEQMNEQLNEKIEQLNEKIEQLNEKIEQLNDKIDRIIKHLVPSSSETGESSKRRRIES